jgi:hypothetical protein
LKVYFHIFFTSEMDRGEESGSSSYHLHSNEKSPWRIQDKIQSGVQSLSRWSYDRKKNSDVLLGTEPYSALNYEDFSVK